MSKKLFNFLVISLLFVNSFFLSAIIAFQITKSGEMATLPDLTGMTLDEAQAELERIKLILVQSGVQLHAHYEKGQITLQDPEPDTKLRLYTPVKVILSAGKEKVIIPDLVGRSLQAIIPLLQESGVRKGIVTHVHSSRYSAGRIFAQSPSPNDEVPINTRMNFLVSEGEAEKKFLMPDLLGKYAVVVRSQLEEMGFRVGDIRRSYYPGYDPGIILNQSPRQGNPILKRNKISLEVSK